MRIAWAFLTAILFSNAMAVELTEKSPLRGVWRGSIGDQQIMVCFDSFESSYYYLRHFYGIPMFEQDERGHSWTEGGEQNPTGRWMLNPVSSNDHLDGQWSDAGGKRFLPIRLSRVKAARKKGTACSSAENLDVFNRPRVDAQKITTGGIQELRGSNYRVISTLNGNVSTIELLGDGTTFAVINQKLRNGLRDAVKEYFECQVSLDRQVGGIKKEDAYFGMSTNLVSFSGKWITLRAGGGGNCGGAHPSNGTTLFTLDVNSGERVQLTEWLIGKTMSNGFYSPPEKLNAVITKRGIHQSKMNHPPKGDQQCLDLLKSYDESYAVSMGETGLVFSTYFPHSTKACDEDIEIPYAKLQPFLTGKGKEAVKVLTETVSRAEQKTDASFSHGGEK